MKKLYIFTFSGASSLGAALALPSDGKVVACDVSEEFTREGQKRWKEAGVAHKVDLRIAPAQETLQKLIDGGEVGQYDFAFIDADKGGYPTYYEQCLQLLRPGGIIAFDNTLRGGRVVLADDQVDDKSVGAMKILNDLVAKDSQRSYVVQLNIADGYTTDVKL